MFCGICAYRDKDKLKSLKIEIPLSEELLISCSGIVGLSSLQCSAF